MFAKHVLSTLAMGAAMALGPGLAVAGPAPLPFCVDDKVYSAPLVSPQNCLAASGPQTGFTADLLTGSYTERANVFAAPASPSPIGLGFEATIVADFDAYGKPGGGSVVPSGLNAFYNIYGVVEADGYLTSGTTFVAQNATLKLYLDVGADGFTDTSLAAINSGTLAFTPGATDILLGSSTAFVSGSGTTVDSGPDDGFEVYFTDFTLEPAGSTFFIAPRPFYLSVYSDGDITGGTVVSGPTSLALRGELSASFFAVPEPGSLALAGLALLGAGLVRRRKTA